MLVVKKDGTKAGSGTKVDFIEGTGIDISAANLDGSETNVTISTEATGIRYANVVVTNAEIIALRATPKTLVAAQGAGTMIELVSATLQLNYGGTNVFTESSDNMIINYVDASGVAATGAIEGTGFIDATADAFTTVLAIPVVNGTTAQVVNTPLILDNTGNGEYAGNAAEDNTMSVFVAYRVHTVA